MSDTADNGFALMARARMALHANRRKRAAFSDCPVDMGDPAWDILLALFSHAPVCRPIPMATIIAETGLPEIATRRYAAQLCEAGLALHKLDQSGSDSARIGLTRKGIKRIRALLAEDASLSADLAA
jgi:hypothetical protein